MPDQQSEMISNTSRPRQSTRVLSQHIGETTVLLDPDKGKYFSLDEVGARIWALFDGTRTVDGIAEAICAEYEADIETVRNDVMELLRNLQAAQLVDIS